MRLRSILINAVIPFGVGNSIGGVFEKKRSIIKYETHFVSEPTQSVVLCFAVPSQAKSKTG
jgi:hypothetical protein